MTHENCCSRASRRITTGHLHPSPPLGNKFGLTLHKITPLPNKKPLPNAFWTSMTICFSITITITIMITIMITIILVPECYYCYYGSFCGDLQLNQWLPNFQEEKRKGNRNEVENSWNSLVSLAFLGTFSKGMEGIEKGWDWRPSEASGDVSWDPSNSHEMKTAPPKTRRT